MPRKFSSSSSNNKSTSRQSSSAVNNPQSNQPGRSSMGSGIMGGLMTGMAFGAGSEIIRQLFRNPTTGGFILPLLLSGGSAYLTRRLTYSHPQSKIFAVAAFGGVFLLTYRGGNSEY